MKPVPTLLRHVLPTVLVGLLVFQFLRTFWLERYIVSSESMEPALHGDPVFGDRVLVDKSAAWWWEPERGDMVVIRNPEDPDSHLIKRVVAFGGERVRLMRGDVFLWDPDLGDWGRWSKDPVEFRDLRMTYFESPGEGEEPVQGFLSGLESDGSGAPGRLAPGAEDLDGLRRLLAERAGGIAGHLGTTRAVDTRFLDAGGVLRGSALLCDDVGMEIDLTGEIGLRGLQLVFECRGDPYWWTYGADGEVRFQEEGGALGKPVQARPLSAGEPVSIEFGYLDGRFFLIVDDRLSGLWTAPLPLLDDRPPRIGAPPHNSLHVAAAGASVVVNRVRVFHDVYYQALDIPFEKREVDVPTGELWLLGDNTFDSRDSRSVGGFPQEDVVGRPVMILGPISRMRVFPR